MAWQISSAITQEAKMYYSQNKRTDSIHRKIIVVCEYLMTGYITKKHGGYKIYSDDKILAHTDTYVPNVTLEVKVGEKCETVFSCNYTGNFVVYRPGEWEGYLDYLYLKSIETRQNKIEAQNLRCEQDTLTSVNVLA